MESFTSVMSGMADSTLNMVSTATTNTLGVFDGWNVSACLTHFFGPKLELLIEEYEHNTNNKLINFSSDGKIEIGLPRDNEESAAFTLNSMALAAVAMEGVVQFAELKVTQLVIDAPIQSFIPGIVDLFPRPIGITMKSLDVDMLGDPFIMSEKTRRTYVAALLGTDEEGEGDPPPWEGAELEKAKSELKQSTPKASSSANQTNRESDGGMFGAVFSAANTTKEMSKAAASKATGAAKSAASKTAKVAGEGLAATKAVAKKGASVVGDGLNKAVAVTARRSSTSSIDAPPEVEPYPMANRVIDGILMEIDEVNVTMLAINTMKERKQGKVEAENIKRKEYLCRCLCFVCGITSCWQPDKDELATLKPKRTLGDATVIHLSGVKMQNTNSKFEIVDDFNEGSYFDYGYDDVGQDKPPVDPITGQPPPTEVRVYKRISVQEFTMSLEGADGLVVPLTCPVEIVMNVTMRKRLPDFESIGTDVELCMPADFPMIGVAAIPTLTRIRLRTDDKMNPPSMQLRSWFEDGMKAAGDKAKWDDALEWTKRSGISDFSKWERFFEAHDKDHSGGLDKDELRVLIKSFGISFEDKEFNALFEKMDVNGDGTVTIKELSDYFEIVKPTSTPHKSKNGSARRVGHSARHVVNNNWMVGDRVMIEVDPTVHAGQPGTSPNYYDDPAAASGQPRVKVATIERKNAEEGTYRVIYDNSTRHDVVSASSILRRESVSDTDIDVFGAAAMEEDHNSSCAS